MIVYNLLASGIYHGWRSGEYPELPEADSSCQLLAWGYLVVDGEIIYSNKFLYSQFVKMPEIRHL